MALAEQGWPQKWLGGRVARRRDPRQAPPTSTCRQIVLMPTRLTNTSSLLTDLPVPRNPPASLPVPSRSILVFP